MFKLTDRRYAKAKPIFDAHLMVIKAGHYVYCEGLENDLCDCWHIGDQELKDILIQLIKDPKYKLIAASYMQQSASGRVATEFKDSLAKLYGVPEYRSRECKKKRDEFWKKVLGR